MKTLGHSQIGLCQRRPVSPVANSLTMNTHTHVLPEIEREVIDAAAKVILE